MKRLALALLFSLISTVCFATCTTPVTGNNATGAAQTFNSVYADVAGNCNNVVGPGLVTNTLTAWTSATTINTTQTLVINPHGAPAVLLQLDQTSTITGGAITIQGTFDGTNWVTVPVAQVLNPASFASLTNPYTLVATTNQPFLILTQGYQSVRINLTTVIAGTGSVTPFVTLLPENPVLNAIYTAVSGPIPAGTNNIGNVGGTVGSGVPTVGPYNGCQARSSEQTAATNGNLVGAVCDLVGRFIVTPYANKENMVRGTVTTAVNTAVTLIAAQGAANKIYVTGLQCYRSDAGTTASTVTLNDTETTGTGTVAVLPNGGGGGGTNLAFNTPLVVALNTALTITSSAAITNVICNAQGYFGT